MKLKFSIFLPFEILDKGHDSVFIFVTECKGQIEFPDQVKKLAVQ